MADGGSIQPFDLQRMFIGDLPWLFTLEVVVRTILMYLYTLLLIRLLSRRALSQLSLIEFALVIALGSAVGDPMFYADVPLLHCFAVITTVVALNRGVNWLMARNEIVERIVEGAPASLIQQGRLHIPNLRRFGLSQEELFEFLRSQGVENLGSVREGYFEQNGQISIFRYTNDQKRVGLALVPPWDIGQMQAFAQGTLVKDEQVLACLRCGFTQKFENQLLPLCPACQHHQWTAAVGKT
ncbi:MAG: DUF421 domain-containing protein [Caldilinea sp. CFX5]|nr:DUF421 domain-containing protein [Caldilinea sp. CFX5]